MAVSADFVETLKDLMQGSRGQGLGPVGSRRMFGGVGLYVDGLMFALVDDDTLYFKVDAQSRPRFEAEGLAPFSYMTKDGRHTLTSYWRAPERVLDEPDEMLDWAGAAAAAARRAGQAKSRRARSRA